MVLQVGENLCVLECRYLGRALSARPGDMSESGPERAFLAKNCGEILQRGFVARGFGLGTRDNRPRLEQGPSGCCKAHTGVIVSAMGRP
jgi:hypothetical protein